MEMSEETTWRKAASEWVKAFRAAQGDFPPISKGTSVTIPTSGGRDYSYKYAALPDILDAVSKALDAHGLTVAQSVSGDGSMIAVETRIYHDAGHVELFGPLTLRVTADAKAAGSAITYARRYALCAALNIAPDEDDDGARASVKPPASPPSSRPGHGCGGRRSYSKRGTKTNACRLSSQR